MVYDATKSGLNQVVWAPNFFLPTIESTLRCMNASTWSGDVDLGEMFLNYMLDEKIQPYAGVDLSRLIKNGVYLKRGDGKEEKITGPIWWNWCRCLMGFGPSPFTTVRGFLWSSEIIYGNPKDETNPLGWDFVVLNLPGMETYDPKIPRVYKWCVRYNAISGDFVTFVDDIRALGKDEDHTTQVVHKIGSKTNSLGQQDAPRKRRKPSQTPGLWNGSLTITDDENVFVSTSQEKWNKGKEIVLRWKTLYDNLNNTSDRPMFNHKQLERDRGFLIHLVRTFPWIMPRLKGIHHTIDIWRGQRDLDARRIWTGYSFR